MFLDELAQTAWCAAFASSCAWYARRRRNTPLSLTKGLGLVFVAGFVGWTILYMATKPPNLFQQADASIHTPLRDMSRAFPAHPILGRARILKRYKFWGKHTLDFPTALSTAASPSKQAEYAVSDRNAVLAFLFMRTAPFYVSAGVATWALCSKRQLSGALLYSFVALLFVLCLEVAIRTDSFDVSQYGNMSSFLRFEQIHLLRGYYGAALGALIFKTVKDFVDSDSYAVEGFLASIKLKERMLAKLGEEPTPGALELERAFDSVARKGESTSIKLVHCADHLDQREAYKLACRDLAEGLVFGAETDEVDRVMATIFG